MTQQQAVRPNEAEQTATSAATEPQVASSMAVEQAETTAAPVEQQPQAAPGSEAGQTSTSPTTEGNCHKDEPLPWYFKSLLAVVIGLWLSLLGWGIFYTDLKWKNLASLGTFGDSFGILNTLFSGLAFLGIIISIKLQRDDLKLQREELSRQGNEMESQRVLAEEYQNERFFVLLLEQIKGQSIIDTIIGINKELDICYTYKDKELGIPRIHNYRNRIQELVSFIYDKTHKNEVKEGHILAINDFASRITTNCSQFQPLFDRITHIYEFIMSLSDEKTRINYARIAYNSIGQYDRIILFMYLVAKLDLRQGDIFGDLLFADYEKLDRI